jgi:hypothetical protein
LFAKDEFIFCRYLNLSHQPKSGARLLLERDLFWVALLAAILAFLLHESLFEGKGLSPSSAILVWKPWHEKVEPRNELLNDQSRTFLPTAEFVHQQKSLPLWNPGICCGTPNLGAIQGALLFPIRLLLSWLDPFSASGPAAFLKLFFAGWFTFLYLRALEVSRPGAFLAGLVFSLSGFMIVWLGHPHVNSAMWLPLFLYLIEKSFRQPIRNLMPWIGFALAYGTMILGGHPPTVIHVTIAITLYFIFRLTAPGRTQAFTRCVLLAGATGVGLLLAAPQILPFMEYYRNSSCELASVSLSRWGEHLAYPALIHFLLPNGMGNPAAGFEDLPNLLGWPEPNNFNERTGYIGIVPLFIAICAVAFRRCRTTKFYLWSLVASMLVVCGVPPFPALLHLLPVLRDVNEMRLFLLVGFSVAVLAGLGWDQFMKRRTDRLARIVAGGFVLVVGLALAWFWFVTHEKYGALDSAHRAFLFKQFGILAVGVAIVVLAVFWPSGKNKWIVAVCCLAWTAIDLLCFARGYNPAISREFYYPRTPGIEWLQSDPSVFRVFGKGSVFLANCPEVFGLSDVRGCDFMSVRRYEELITGQAGSFFFYHDPKGFPNTYPLLDAKYFLTDAEGRLNPALFELVYSKDMTIYQYKKCLGRALLVFDCEVDPDPAIVLDRVSSGNFDPRRQLLLEEQPPPALPVSGSAETNAVQITSYQPDDVTIETSASRPGFLLLLDTYFPGWKATVNGSPAPILRADYNFRAVPIPAGQSTVLFSYRPESFRVGLILCGAGALILAVAGFLSWKL